MTFFKSGFLPVYCLVWLLFNIPTAGGQNYHFDYNANCQKAHQSLLKYETDSARYFLSKTSDQNLVAPYLANYFDFYQLLSYENRAAYDSLLTLRKTRLDQLDKGPEDSPFALFAKAEVRLQWAVIKAKFGDYWSAGWDFNKAYRLLKTNQKQYPDFIPTQKSLLPIKAAIGTLPDQYEWIAGILGFEGDLEKAGKAYEKALRQLKDAPEYKAIHKEAGFIQGLMQYHLFNQPEAAWNTTQALTADYKENPASAFFRANMAMRTKQRRALVRTLASYKHKEPAIPHLDYLAGNAMLYRLNPESRRFFGRYIREFEGHSYVKDSYLKMAWAYLLKGDLEQYQNAVFLAKHKGKTIRGEDQQAMRELDHYNKENLYLLKARLRFDGGQYRKALKWLQKHSPQQNQPVADRMEFHYRKARIHQKLDEYEKALAQFDQVFGFEDGEAYYEPAAHLYSGEILEVSGRLAQAKTHYNKVLDFSDYPYERSFTQKAKAGLKRIE